MGKILHLATAEKIFNTPPRREYYKPGPVMKKLQNMLYRNRTIHTDRTLAHNKPDKTLWLKKRRKFI